MSFVGGELLYVILLAAINHAPAGVREFEVRVGGKPLVKVVKDGDAWVEQTEKTRITATFDALTLTPKAGGQKKVELGKELGVKQAEDWQRLKEAKFRNHVLHFEKTKDGLNIANSHDGKVVTFVVTYKLADGK